MGISKIRTDIGLLFSKTLRTMLIIYHVLKAILFLYIRVKITTDDKNNSMIETTSKVDKSLFINIMIGVKTPIQSFTCTITSIRFNLTFGFRDGQGLFFIYPLNSSFYPSF